MWVRSCINGSDVWGLKLYKWERCVGVEVV